MGFDMTFMDRIAECNRHDLAKFCPFVVDDHVMGWVRRDLAERLRIFSDVFIVTMDRVILHPRLETPEQRSFAFHQAAKRIVADWGMTPLKGEMYPVVKRWGQTPLMLMDRSMVVLFGVPSHGVHVNGFVRGADGLSLWIGTRAMDKAVAPGKLDNMVAGGQPHGLSLTENLVKEAAEEADIPETLARQAKPVGLITYVREDDWGLRPDVMFCFDLEVPANFVPVNTDGEMSGFTLMPIEKVAQIVRDTLDFKLNVNLVIIDFLVRHGVLHPDNLPEYQDVVQGLRRTV